MKTRKEDTMVKDGFFVKPIYDDYRVKIRYNEIEWIEADNNHSHIHLRGTRPVTVCFKLQQVEQILPRDCFTRISRSEIINIYMVSKYCGNLLYLEGCTHQFYVTEKHRDTVFACFLELTK